MTEAAMEPPLYQECDAQTEYNLVEQHLPFGNDAGR